MKYVVVLGDGMADEPVKELGGKTPLEYADTPVMDRLASMGQMGLAYTIPEGMSPGSDTANLSVLGYDPRKYYTGRSPLEALSIGVDMEETDVALRANLVTLSEEGAYGEKVILDHSAGEISTREAEILLDAVRRELENDTFRLYTGTSYRHCLIWKNGRTEELTAPHDILEKPVGPYLPVREELLRMQERSYEILSGHPLNLERKSRGLNPANSLWFWGAGTRPALDSFQGKFGKKGVMISAVDLLKGIAVGAGLTNVIVEGANGGLHTNYEGKAQAAVDALTKKGYDFAYIHVEAPDEMGHQGSTERKVQSIRYLDRRLIRPLTEGLEASGEDYRLLVMPDHPTPIRLRTHTADPVPWLLYDSTRRERHTWTYCEAEAARTGCVFLRGHELMAHLLKKEI